MMRFSSRCAVVCLPFLIACGGSDPEGPEQPAEQPNQPENPQNQDPNNPQNPMDPGVMDPQNPMNPQDPMDPPMMEPEPPPGPEGLPILGRYKHTPDSVVIDIIGTSADGLNVPRDLEFNPMLPDELWVVNRGDESMTVYSLTGTPQQTAMRYWKPSGAHFMAQPAALAFGTGGSFATIHETDDLTQGPGGTPEDFMGPTLWTSNRNIFDGGHGGHIDMLHNTPNGAGIAWEADNIYWVFDGYHNSLTRYNFNLDHGPGGADHSDGIITRYVEGQVSWVENVPSHMEVDREARLLFVADTGNNRIAVLNIDAGTTGNFIFPNYDGVSQYEMLGAELITVVNGADAGMQRPSGLALLGDHIFVSDNATGKIHAFDRTGVELDWLETGLPQGALMGITFDLMGNLYAVDATQNQVVRITAKPADE